MNLGQQIEQQKKEIKRQIEKEGYVKVSVDLRSVSLKTFIKNTEKSGYWLFTESITFLEGEPLMAIVWFGLDVSKKPDKATVMEYLTNADKDRMIKEYMEQYEEEKGL